MENSKDDGQGSDSGTDRTVKKALQLFSLHADLQSRKQNGGLPSLPSLIRLTSMARNLATQKVSFYLDLLA